ncbi:hypothetical protein QEN19_001012 [Hanseniaspora menglaensis]
MFSDINTEGLVNDNLSKNGSMAHEQRPLSIEFDNDSLHNSATETKILTKREQIDFNINLTLKDVKNNFFNENIVERKITYSKEEIEFFINMINKETDEISKKNDSGKKNEDFLQVVQAKYGIECENFKKKTKNTSGKVEKTGLEILKPKLSLEAEHRYLKILEDLEYLKNNKITNKYDPMISYFDANHTQAYGPRTKQYKENPSLLGMPVVINNTIFKNMEKKLIDEDLDPFLQNVMLKNFRNHYYTYTLEILAEKTIVFYGLGFKKDFLHDFSQNLTKELKLYYTMKEDIPICEINGLDVPNRYNTLYKVFRDTIAIPVKKLKEFEQKIDKRDRQLWGDHALDELELFERYYRFMRASKDKNERQEGNIKVVLMIHNVDAEMFRKPSFKKFVAAIAKVPVIALVLSADHVRFPFSFERNLVQMIKPSYHCLNTLKPFPIEGYINQNDRDRFFSYFDILKTEGASYKKRIVKVSTTTKGPSVYDEDSGLASIFKSLTKKNLKIFRLLVATLLERRQEKRGITKAKVYRIPIREFLSLCQKEFLVSDEVSLRKALCEFVDHSLCSLGDKNRMGIEFLDSGYSDTELEFLLANQLANLSSYI